MWPIVSVMYLWMHLANERGSILFIWYYFFKSPSSWRNTPQLSHNALQHWGGLSLFRSVWNPCVISGFSSVSSGLSSVWRSSSPSQCQWWSGQKPLLGLKIFFQCCGAETLHWSKFVCNMASSSWGCDDIFAKAVTRSTTWFTVLWFFFFNYLFLALNPHWPFERKVECFCFSIS